MGIVKTVQPFLSIENQSANTAASCLSSDQEQPAILAPEESKPGRLALSRAAQTQSVNWLVLGFMFLFHCGAIAAFFFFSWSALVTAVILHAVAINIGIGMSYHRLLTHRGYPVPRWLEYLLAICATLSLEGGPLTWVTPRRIHHQHPDRLGDP